MSVIGINSALSIVHAGQWQFSVVTHAPLRIERHERCPINGISKLNEFSISV